MSLGGGRKMVQSVVKELDEDQGGRRIVEENLVN